MRDIQQREKLQRRLNIAKGAAPADLVLRHGRLVNVFSGLIEEKDIAIAGTTIAGVGQYESGRQVVDLGGKYVLPGLIDAHIHVESSHLTPSSFGDAALAHGTTSVIADPHEIANVLGTPGLEFMFQDALASPLDIFFMLPSAVPATAQETAGAEINAATVESLFAGPMPFWGLGEVMNAPGVIQGDPEVLDKIIAASGRVLDGHYPGGTGLNLNAYCSVGINSDHESVSLAEAQEKLALGMTVFIREGSSARNLAALLPLVNDDNWPCFCFCADDLSAAALNSQGDILPMIRRAVALGLSPQRAVQIATINPARHYGLRKRGAVAPGYWADLVIVEDLQDFNLAAVYKNGQAYTGNYQAQAITLGNVTLPDLSGLDFPQLAGHEFARVIKVLPTEIITPEKIYPVSQLPAYDIAKLMILERHGKNGNQAFGLVEGSGLKRGAIASTIAHDSHNLLVLGQEPKEMALAAQALADQGGGAVVTLDGQVLARMPLPVAGLMTGQTASATAKAEEELSAAARRLGLTLPAPLMTLSFLALPVIPQLKLTDKGLFDVEKFTFVPLYFD